MSDDLGVLDRYLTLWIALATETQLFPDAREGATPFTPATPTEA